MGNQKWPQNDKKIPFVPWAVCSLWYVKIDQIVCVLFHLHNYTLLFDRFNHFAKLHDIQMLGMLACLFLKQCAQFDSTTRKTLHSMKLATKLPAQVKVPNGNHHTSLYKSLPPTAATARLSPPYRIQAQVRPSNVHALFDTS